MVDSAAFPEAGVPGAAPASQAKRASMAYSGETAMIARAASANDHGTSTSAVSVAHVAGLRLAVVAVVLIVS